MRQTLLGIVACALGLAFAASPAAAQDPSKIGTLLFGYATSLDPNGPGGSVGGSIAGYQLKDGVAGAGFEFGYHYLGSVGEGTFSARQGMWQTTINLRAQASEGKVLPYFVGGAGVYWVYTSLGDPKFASQTVGRFGFNLGGGLAFPVQKQGAQFIVDVRWHEAVEGNYDDSSLDALTIYGGFAMTRR
jgi:hypothetical protein